MSHSRTGVESTLSGRTSALRLLAAILLVCGDVDGDTCDDCAISIDGYGPLSDSDPADDGTDTDGDGLCDAGDPDDDNDGVVDGVDAEPLNQFACADADADTCDDCSSGVSSPANDGTDADGDGACDAGDPCPVDAADDSDGDGACDSEDICEGYDDTVDVDADAIPDGCDACANPGAQNITIKPKLQLKKINTDSTVGNDGLTIKGEFVSATAFSALDPVANGARVVIDAADGTNIVDVTIPGGAGWSVNSSATKYVFRDKGDPAANNGITKVQIQDRDTKAADQVKVTIKGKDGVYPVLSGDEPLRATVVVGDGTAGECGDTDFQVAECLFNGSGNAIVCR